MNICGVTRLLVPAMFVGMAVSTWVRSDGYGLLAAVATAGVLHLVQRIRGTGASCALPPVATARTPVHDGSETGDGQPGPVRAAKDPS